VHITAADLDDEQAVQAAGLELSAPRDRGSCRLIIAAYGSDRSTGLMQQRPDGNIEMELFAGYDGGWLRLGQPVAGLRYPTDI
jgi:hypothetical protein